MIDMKQEKKRVNKLRADTNITMDTLKYGDKVQFSCNGKNGIQGTIIVKDYQGGGLYYAICPSDVGRILRTFKIKKNVEVTDNGKIII